MPGNPVSVRTEVWSFEMKRYVGKAVKRMLYGLGLFDCRQARAAPRLPKIDHHGLVFIMAVYKVSETEFRNIILHFH